jgi:hypothetical protein
VANLKAGIYLDTPGQETASGPAIASAAMNDVVCQGNRLLGSQMPQV